MTNTQSTQTKTTADPTNATFLAHTQHVHTGKRSTWCRLCADHGVTAPLTWARFVAAYPEWNAR